jgi:hypothetical protein
MRPYRSPIDRGAQREPCPLNRRPFLSRHARAAAPFAGQRPLQTYIATAGGFTEMSATGG